MKIDAQEVRDRVRKAFNELKSSAEMGHDHFGFYRPDIIIGYSQAMKDAISTVISVTFDLESEQQIKQEEDESRAN